MISTPFTPSGDLSKIIRDGSISLDVIGDQEPLGMCGSGLVDAVSELVKAGYETLVDAGYDPKLACGSLLAGGTLGAPCRSARAGRRTCCRLISSPRSSI